MTDEHQRIVGSVVGGLVCAIIAVFVLRHCEPEPKVAAEAAPRITFPQTVIDRAEALRKQMGWTKPVVLDGENLASEVEANRMVNLVSLAYLAEIRETQQNILARLEQLEI